ncbi:MFS transporter [Neorhizobium sp. JUb45]|uniref:MFS transporter n=1 Tax=unclassified Neorhizobium TaxID=2629175 RepID=UPI001053EC74|nr:MFS transporter [Neorhizobium sp. JUb45]TCR03016.1 DHA1 family inner membrane transport protein [Neorhizobium sp. JUb45]
MPLAVYALAVGAFAICTTEFVIVGLLLNISKDFAISISASGMLVTAYAMGVVIGAPLLTPFVAGLPRKPVLIGLMGLYIVGNLACAVAPSYELLMVARIVSALVQASFFGLGAVVATQLVAPGKQASAVAAMFLGATLANVFGAPGGTLLGQAFGWRSTFIACSAIGLLAAIAITLIVPRVKTEKPKNIGAEFASLASPRVLKALLITILGFGGIFTALTYIAPLLTQVTGFPETAVSWLLLLFGVGMVVGNPIGGRLTDKSLRLGIVTTLSALTVTLVAIGAFATYQIPSVILVFLFGAAMFATIPPLQVQAMQAADEAPVLGSAFNIAAFNLANAGGAWLGGYALDQGVGLAGLPVLAAIVSAIGLGFAIVAKAGAATTTSIATPAE